MIRHLLTLALIFYSSAAFAQDPITEATNTDALNIEGLWLVESGNGKVEVKDCGDGTPCGTLVWIDETQGESFLDVKNANPKLRERPLLGSPVFWGFEKKGDQWKSGYIYDAEGGKTYKSKIKLSKDGKLKVKGCVGPICQSQIWTKISP